MWKALKAVFSAIAALFKFIFRGFFAAGKFGWRVVHEVVPAVVEAVGSVGVAAEHVVLGAATGVGNVVRAVFGPKPPAPQPQEAARKATAEAKTAKAEVATIVASAEAVAEFKRMARAIGRGKQPVSADIGALPPALAVYLSALRKDEARILGQLPTELLLATIRGERRQEGVRTPADVMALAKPKVVASQDVPTPSDEARPEYEGYPTAA
jgi:hypothetical protein